MDRDEFKLKWREIPIGELTSNIDLFELRIQLYMPTKDKTMTIVSREDSRFWNFPYLKIPDSGNNLEVKMYIEEREERRRIIRSLSDRIAHQIISALAEEEKREPPK